MFHPNLSNRGKANFIVGVVILVFLFCWLISRSSRSSKENPIASEIGGDLKQDIRTGRVKSQSRMASLDGVAVELHRDMDLLSPPLPEEIERKREAMEQPTADTLDVDVCTVLIKYSPPPPPPPPPIC